MAPDRVILCGGLTAAGLDTEDADPVLVRRYGSNRNVHLRIEDVRRAMYHDVAPAFLDQWMYTLVELCSWDEDKSDLTDRSDRPWDNVARGPSHADRRRRIAREMLRKSFPATELPPSEVEKIRAHAEALYTLCV